MFRQEPHAAMARRRAEALRVESAVDGVALAREEDGFGEAIPSSSGKPWIEVQR